MSLDATVQKATGFQLGVCVYWRLWPRRVRLGNLYWTVWVTSLLSLVPLVSAIRFYQHAKHFVGQLHISALIGQQALNSVVREQVRWTTVHELVHTVSLLHAPYCERVHSGHPPQTHCRMHHRPVNEAWRQKQTQAAAQIQMLLRPPLIHLHD